MTNYIEMDREDSTLSHADSTSSPDGDGPGEVREPGEAAIGDRGVSWKGEELSELLAEFEMPLLAYASRMLGGDWQSAQDAVQETFLRLCREPRSKIEGRIRPWLFAVCRSRVIDMQRTNHSHNVDAGEISLADPAPDAAQSAMAAEQESVQSNRLASLVAQLSPRQQEVIRLRMHAGLSYREIAEVTGLTVTNVGFHLHAAIRSLKTAVATP